MVSWQFGAAGENWAVKREPPCGNRSRRRRCTVLFRTIGQSAPFIISTLSWIPIKIAQKPPSLPPSPFRLPIYTVEGTLYRHFDTAIFNIEWITINKSHFFFFFLKNKRKVFEENVARSTNHIFEEYFLKFYQELAGRWETKTPILLNWRWKKIFRPIRLEMDNFHDSKKTNRLRNRVARLSILRDFFFFFSLFPLPISIRIARLTNISGNAVVVRVN